MLGLALGLGAAAIGLFASSAADDRYEREKEMREKLQKKYDKLNDDYYELEDDYDDMCDEVDELNYTCSNLREKNRKYKLTIENHSRLLSNYDKINRYAKSIGFDKGAVEFFYFLTDEHDERFRYYAKFLKKVRHMRNDVAHNGNIYYDINDNFLYDLEDCLELCYIFDRLPNNKRFYLPYDFR